MRIVILDGHTLNPGDLSWDGLGRLGDLAVHERTPAGEIVERARGAEVLITNKAPLDRATLEALSALRYVGVTATGYNIVDVAAAREHGVTVTNVPSYGTESVAQAAWALLLELANRVGHHDRTVHEGRWTASPDFAYWDGAITELAGGTFGVVGYGAIGRAAARIARAFGMRVIASTRTPRADEGVEFADLDTLFAEADIVSLHCPLTPETERLVNAERLARMKPTGFIVNTARGGLVDERALADALAKGTIAGAGLDVLSVEPPPASNPLLAAPNCVITPHIAWASRAARKRLLAAVVANLEAFLAGAPVNVVEA